MEKNKLGWLINCVLTIGVIGTSVIFPNPAIIFPVVAGATLTGTIQSMFTIVESKEEKEDRERKELIRIASVEKAENNLKPEKVYESLHSNSKQANFSGNHRVYSSSNSLSNKVNKIERQDEEMRL